MLVLRATKLSAGSWPTLAVPNAYRIATQSSLGGRPPEETDKGGDEPAYLIFYLNPSFLS